MLPTPRVTGVGKIRLVRLVHLGASRAIKVGINVKDRIRDRVTVTISIRANADLC